MNTFTRPLRSSRISRFGALVLVAVALVVAVMLLSGSPQDGSTEAGSGLPDARTQSMADEAPGAVSDGLTEVSVRSVDGGVGYYDKFENGLPSSPNFFPIGVWFESVLNQQDLSKDQAMGLNTYVELTADSDVSVARGAGMYVVSSFTRPEVNGFLVTDEPDMWAGPGTGHWTGNYPGQGDVCRPSDEQCGYTVMETLLQNAPEGFLTYANFGKGVAFWETDEEAARFVNYTDIVSADNYWFTDPNICGPGEGGRGPGGDGEEMSVAECRLAANYGWTVQRVRDLVSPERSKPVWNFVEVGHPAGEDWAPTITAEQIRAAVWSGIIHGARGIVYFNHNFGGNCISQHVLREACGDAVRPAVIAVNQQLADLAPVLNAPFVDGLVTVQGPADVAVKIHNGAFTLIAGSTDHASHEITLILECATADTATVIGENRTLPVVNGIFTDTFDDGNAVHIYQLDGSSCGVG